MKAIKMTAHSLVSYQPSHRQPQPQQIVKIFWCTKNHPLLVIVNFWKLNYLFHFFKSKRVGLHLYFSLNIHDIFFSSFLFIAYLEKRANVKNIFLYNNLLW